MSEKREEAKMDADKIERQLEEKKVQIKNAVKSGLRKRIFSEVEYEKY